MQQLAFLVCVTLLLAVHGQPPQPPDESGAVTQPDPTTSPDATTQPQDGTNQTMADDATPTQPTTQPTELTPETTSSPTSQPLPTDQPITPEATDANKTKIEGFPEYSYHFNESDFVTKVIMSFSLSF